MWEDGPNRAVRPFTNPMRPLRNSSTPACFTGPILVLWLSMMPVAVVAGAGHPQRAMGIREAVNLAMQEDPDAQLARLEIEKSATDLALVRAEGTPTLRAGSGLGATYGIPQSIQGAVPSIAQLTVIQPLIDPRRPRRVDEAREIARSREFASEAAAEQSAYRTALLFLDFALSTTDLGRLRRELESFQRIEQLVVARVAEGTEVQLAASRSRLDAARARERVVSTESRAALLESELKSLLGLGADVGIRPEGGPEEISAIVSDTVQQAGMSGSGEHPDMKALNARVRAARFRVRSARADRLPRLDLVGQYALLARFNNYDEFFRRFERHNWQAGVAFEIPLFQGRGVAEKVAQARLEERELELRQDARETAIALERERSEATLHEAQRLCLLAKQELEFARERLGVLLAQFDEGLIAMDELERGRVLESNAWGGLIAAQYEVAKARLATLHATGSVHKAFTD